jgi:hypothetical protein
MNHGATHKGKGPRGRYFLQVDFTIRAVFPHKTNTFEDELTWHMREIRFDDGQYRCKTVYISDQCDIDSFSFAHVNVECRVNSARAVCNY